MRHKNLGGCDTDHLIEQCLSRGQFRDTELAGAQVGASQTESPSRLLRGEDGGREIVTLLLESRVLEGSGTNDPGDLAADELSRLDLAHLLAQRDAAPGGQQFLHVAARGVIRNAAHRHLTALRQGDVQDRRGLLGIVEKHLVEVPEPEKQEGPWRTVTPQGVILLHHRCCFGGHEKGGG